MKSVLLFILAAVLEIGGAWLVWQGVREHRGWIWIGAGVVALLGSGALGGEGGPAEGDMDALAVRWPGWHARLAHFLMDDPLQATRARLGDCLARCDAPHDQRDLFA